MSLGLKGLTYYPEIFFSHQAVWIHGLGAAINRAINLALQLKHRGMGTVEVGVSRCERHGVHLSGTSYFGCGTSVSSCLLVERMSGWFYWLL